MRFIAALMWALAAWLCVMLTLGNIALVRFQQTAEAALVDVNLGSDIYASSLLPQATRWISKCLSEDLLARKELQLKQLDRLYGHEPLDETQRRLEQALAFLLDFLRCNPGDGSAWLAAAMVMNTINNDADITMQYLALSRFYSPNDEKAVRSRSAILRSVSQRLKNGYPDMFMEAPAAPARVGEN